MMGRVLGNHPDVFTFGELHFFGQLWSPSISSTIELQDAKKLTSELLCIQREGYRTHGDSNRYLQDALTICETFSKYPITSDQLFSFFLYYEANLNGKSIPCDQTPRNVFYIDEILKFYPQAKIINMIRDPRDVLLSQKQKWKRRFLGGTDLPIKETLRDWVNYHPITISHIWHTAVTAADKFSNNNRIITIYFEQLLSKPETTVTNICDFLEIDYSKKLLQVPQVGSSVDVDKPAQTGINPNRAGDWNDSNLKSSKLNSSEIYISQKLNKTLMQKHDYKPVIIRPNILSLISNLISFPVKVVGAFLINLDRIKNIRETLRRRL